MRKPLYQVYYINYYTNKINYLLTFYHIQVNKFNSKESNKKKNKINNNSSKFL